MGYPVSGIQGAITSVTGSTDLASLLDPSSGALKPNSAEITSNAPELNTTGQADTAYKHKTGLREWSMTYRCLYPRSAPIIGATSNVTFSSGQVYKINRWSLGFAPVGGVLPVSHTGQSDKTWAYFKPGRLVKASGTVEMLMESSAAVTMPTATTGSHPTLTFALTDESTDPSIAGAFSLTQLGIAVPIGEDGLNTVRYSAVSSGALTATSGTSSPCCFPAGTIDGPDWDTDGDGEPDVQIVFTAVSGRTFTGYCFWQSVSFDFSMGALASASVQLKGTGPLTPA